MRVQLSPLCEKCPLNAAQGCAPVLPKMHAPEHEPRYLVLGEAPGPTEVQRGIPFVGDAGGMLRETLVEAKIDINDCIFANATWCMPHKDGMATKFRKPTPEETSACLPHTLRLIEKHSPPVIILAGNAALEAFTGLKKITAERGNVYRLGDFYQRLPRSLRYLDYHKWAGDNAPDALDGFWRYRFKAADGTVAQLQMDGAQEHGYRPFLEDKTTVVPVFHPSYVLREGKGTKTHSLFRSDLLSATTIGKLASVEKKYSVINDFDALERYADETIEMHRSGTCDFIAVDVEGSEELGEKYIWMSPFHPRTRIFTVQVSREDHEGVLILVNHVDSVFNTPFMLRKFIAVFSRLLHAVPVVGHNYEFDYKFLRCKLGIKDYKVVGDTLLADHWLTMGQDVMRNLPAIGRRYLGAPNHKVEMRAWRLTNPGKTFEDAPRDIETRYGCLSGNSLVQLGDGSWRQIRALVQDRYDGTVKAVVDGCVVDATVTGWHRADVRQREWYRLVTSTTPDGSGPLFTPEHEIYTDRGRVRVDELQAGVDSILTDENTFSSDQMSVFLGTVLGDGGLGGRNGKSVGLRFGQRSSCVGYAEWKAAVFAPFSPKHIQAPDKFVRYALPYSRYLASLLRLFPKRKREDHGHCKTKITGNVLSLLGVLGLAVWYQDDGTLVKNRDASRIYAKLPDEEAQLLVSWLQRLFGSEVAYNERQGFVRIRGGAFQEFHKVIAPFVHPSMAYKSPLTIVGSEVISPEAGPLFYELLERVEPAHPDVLAARGWGVRFCLTVPEAGNFVTHVGVVANCGDTDVTRLVYKEQVEQLRDEERYDDYYRLYFGQHESWQAIVDMMYHGMLYDPVEWGKLNERFPERITTVRQKLNANPHVLNLIEHSRKQHNMRAEEYNYELKESGNKRKKPRTLYDASTWYHEVETDKKTGETKHTRWWNPSSDKAYDALVLHGLGIMDHKHFFNDLETRERGDTPKRSEHNRAIFTSAFARMARMAREALAEVEGKNDQRAAIQMHTHNATVYSSASELFALTNQLASLTKTNSTYVRGVPKLTADYPVDDKNPADVRSRMLPIYRPFADQPLAYCLHSELKMHGTVSGRLSSANPNGQNWPKRKADKETDVTRIYISRWCGRGGLLLGADYCLVAGTPVVTADGVMPIEEVVEKLPPVLSSPDGRTVEFQRTTRGALVGTLPIVEMMLEDGSVVRCTEDHKWMRFDGSMAKTSELRPGDRLAHVRSGLSGHYPTWYMRSNRDYAYQHHALADFLFPSSREGRHRRELEVDHIDGDIDNNTRENLRVISRVENRGQGGKRWWTEASDEERKERSRKLVAGQAKRRSYTGSGNPNFGKTKKVEAVCPTCGVTFHAAPSARKKFCSKSCYTPERRSAARKRGSGNHRVRSIKPVGVAPVYQITVEGTHNYVLGNGLVSGNSQIEVRVMVMLAVARDIAVAIDKGLDIHKVMASRVYRCAYEEVTKAQRTPTKSITFGILYGQGVNALATKLQIAKEEAEALVKVFFDQIPEVKLLIDRYHAFAEENGYIDTLFNRLRYIPTAQSKKQYEVAGAKRRAVNTPIQSAASDMTLSAIGRCWKTAKALGIPNGIPWLTIHDAQYWDTLDCTFDLMELIYYQMALAPYELWDWVMCRPEAEFDLGTTWGTMVEASFLWEDRETYVFDKEHLNLTGSPGKLDLVCDEWRGLKVIGEKEHAHEPGKLVRTVRVKRDRVYCTIEKKRLVDGSGSIVKI